MPPTTPTPEPIERPRAAYSIAEIAADTGLSRRTIYHEIAAGKLITIKIRDRRLVLPEHREAWLASYIATARAG